MMILKYNTNIYHNLRIEDAFFFFCFFLEIEVLLLRSLSGTALQEISIWKISSSFILLEKVTFSFTKLQC